ncbi:hypothetical protein AB205_0165450, partial [Aquarana catesbeiana]
MSPGTQDTSWDLLHRGDLSIASCPRGEIRSFTSCPPRGEIDSQKMWKGDVEGNPVIVKGPPCIHGQSLDVKARNSQDCLADFMAIKNTILIENLCPEDE